MGKIDISVVIPVKNGQRYLDAVLKAVFSQKISAGFEVIVVDSGSKDKTPDIAGNYPVGFYRIREEDFNHGLSRNYGISKAKGQYVILMTADAIPCNDSWMEKLTANLAADGEVAGAYSRQVPHQDSSALTRIRTSRFFTFSAEKRESRIIDRDAYSNLPFQDKHRFCNFDNVSSCIRRSVWEKMPFPRTDFAEDLEWSKSVLEAGYKIVYEPGSIVYHSHDFSPLAWHKKNMVNYRKLYSLFGPEDTGSRHSFLADFMFYTLRDCYSLCRDYRRIKTILSSITLIPAYSFAAAFAQYRSIKDYTRSITS